MNIQPSIANSAGLPAINVTSAKHLQEANSSPELAQEFESMFMSLLLKELRKTVEGGLFGGEKSDSLGAMFDLYMGKHMSESQPLGISNAVNTYLERSSYHGQNQPDKT